MAYALQSLVQILEQDQHKHHLSPAIRSEINSFLEKARSLRDLVESTSFPITEDLEIRIRDASYMAEDRIESHIAEQVLDNSVSEDEDDYDLELTDVIEELDSINEQIDMLQVENVRAGLERSLPTIVSTSSPHHPNPTERVWGFNRDVNRLKNQVLSEHKSQLQVIPIVGIAGSGKTKLADYLYYDLSVSSHVDIRAWTTISQEFNLRVSLLSLLDCLIHVTADMRCENDNQLGEYLSETLVNKRYFIVLDDIWNTKSWDELRKFFPDNNNGSRIILTTREWNLADYAKTSFHPHQILPIDDISSWNLLCEKVFGGACYCPPELVETGFRIARNCRGHRLAIVTIAGTLPASGDALDVWHRIESQQLNSRDTKDEFDSIKEHKISKIHQVDPSLKGIVKFFTKNGLRLMSQLMHGRSKLQIIPVVGVAKSTGKTILARLLYDRALRGQHFDVHAWVSIKQRGTLQSNRGNVLATIQDLLDSLHKCGMPHICDNDIVVRLHKTLMNRRYLIVVDNLRDFYTWGTMNRFFPDQGNGSRIILTAREWSDCDGIKPFRLDSYWEFLLGKVGTLIPTAEKKLEFWKLVEEEYASSEESKNDDLNLDLVSMSYNTLPNHLKPCFLYMGAFPEDYEINTGTMIQMWIAEGFVRPVAENSLEDSAIMYLESLISRNLLFACEKDVYGKAKSFKIHDVLWKFCQKKALDEKFLWFKEENCQNNLDGEMLRRVSVNPKCLPSNDEDEDMSSARSFLCISPASLNLAPMFLVLRLLRVLDVFELEFHEFPQELLQLINLRYMALKCYSDLPSSISIFRNLQTLFVWGVLSLPSELWELTQLRYIECCSRNCIWNISGNGESVCHEELQTIFYIPASEVTFEFLRHNPNLKNLVILFNDSVHVSIPLDCLKSLKYLTLLESKYNLFPYLGLPPSLKELNLKSCIIHSEFVKSCVAMLPLLERLVLEKCDLVDLEWNATEGGFTRLRYLWMEDLNIVHWRANSTHFPMLEELKIHCCHSMEEIPFDLGNIPTLGVIEVDEKCSPSVFASAKRIKSEQMNLGNDLLRVIFHGGAENMEPRSKRTLTENASHSSDRESKIQKLEKSSREDLYQIERQNSTEIVADEAETKGYMALSTGNYNDAIKHYTDAINSSPSNHLLYSHRSEAYDSLDQYSEALSDAKKIVQLKPDLSIGYIHIGHYNTSLNNYKDAISALEKALEIDSDNDYLKSVLSGVKGRLASSANKFVEAIQHYTEAIIVYPRNHDDYYNRSSAHTSLKQFSEALSDAQKTVQLKPDRIEGYSLLGDAYFNLQKYNDALSVFENGLEIDPSNDDLKWRLTNAKGSVALHNRNFVDAIQHQTDGINLYPSNATLYFNRSLAHTHFKQFSAALSDAQKTVQLKPDWIRGYFQLGHAYFDLKKYKDAVSAYKKVFEIDPSNNDLRCEFLNAKGTVAFINGNFIDAIQHYTDAITLYPSNDILYCNRSEAHSSLKKFSKAMSDAQEAVRLQPDWSQGYSSLGDIYLGLQIYKDAVSAYEKALKFRPTNAKLKSALIIAKAAWAIRKRKDNHRQHELK